MFNNGMITPYNLEHSEAFYMYGKDINIIAQQQIPLFQHIMMAN
jgi:hypothetical protein